MPSLLRRYVVHDVISSGLYVVHDVISSDLRVAGYVLDQQGLKEVCKHACTHTHTHTHTHSMRTRPVYLAAGAGQA